VEAKLDLILRKISCFSEGPSLPPQKEAADPGNDLAAEEESKGQESDKENVDPLHCPNSHAQASPDLFPTWKLWKKISYPKLDPKEREIYDVLLEEIGGALEPLAYHIFKKGSLLASSKKFICDTIKEFHSFSPDLKATDVDKFIVRSRSQSKERGKPLGQETLVKKERAIKNFMVECFNQCRNSFNKVDYHSMFPEQTKKQTFIDIDDVKITHRLLKRKGMFEDALILHLVYSLSV